jgi:hypothetical protein
MLDLSDIPPSYRLPVLRSLIRLEQFRADHHLAAAADAPEGSADYHEHLGGFARAGERVTELQALLSSPLAHS